jgi:hypothetical protein
MKAFFQTLQLLLFYLYAITVSLVKLFKITLYHVNISKCVLQCNIPCETQTEFHSVLHHNVKCSYRSFYVDKTA